MSEKAYRVDYYKAIISNRPGEGAKILSALKKEGINLLGFTGFPRKGKSQVDFIPQNSKAFSAAAKRIGLRAFLCKDRTKWGQSPISWKNLEKQKLMSQPLMPYVLGKEGLEPYFG